VWRLRESPVCSLQGCSVLEDKIGRTSGNFVGFMDGMPSTVADTPTGRVGHEKSTRRQVKSPTLKSTRRMNDTVFYS